MRFVLSVTAVVVLGAGMSVAACSSADTPLEDALPDGGAPDVAPTDAALGDGGPADVAPTTQCGPGTVQCGDRCVDVSLDPENCGLCGKTCAAGEVCSSGTCGLSCTGGTSKCGDRCVDTKSDARNCGGCGTDAGANRCGSGTVCSDGTCALTCANDLVACNGGCVDPLTSRQFCGATSGCGEDAGSAGTSCTAGQVCAGGACQASCLPNQVLCGGRCVDPDTDRQYCGATAPCDEGAGSAGTSCGDGEVCSGGACSASCASPLTRCTPDDGAPYCADTAGDPSNCGTCGTTCPARASATAACANGACAFVCTADHADCNVQADDGCEVNLLTDKDNCGRCGNACDGLSCVGGTCVLTCADILTTEPVWGYPAKGVSLSRFTSGTLDWIGCATGDGCSAASFFCDDEPTGIFFGAVSGALRAVVDPDDAGGSTLPTSPNGCCSAAHPRSICNAPKANNNGVGGIDSGDALCKAMGFASGAVVQETDNNYCSKPHALSANGATWTSNFQTTGNDGFGQQYRCTR